MPTRLTEQQRAYMFEHWPEVCEIPWNKVCTKGNFAVALSNMKRDARKAHPAGGARPAAAATKTIAKKAPAKSIPAAGNFFPTKKGLKKYPIALCENAAFRNPPAAAEDPLEFAKKQMEEMRNSDDPHKEAMLEMMGFMMNAWSARGAPAPANPAPANPAPANPAPAEEPDDGDEPDPDDLDDDEEPCANCGLWVSTCSCRD